MKENDLVLWNGKVAIITEIYESKMWRTSDFGRVVNFAEIDPEPFALIFVLGDTRGVPLTDLEPLTSS